MLTQDDEILQAQDLNLRSAIAFSALTTPSDADEKTFYRNIIELPHYQTNRLFELIDREKSDEIIDEYIDKYR